MARAAPSGSPGVGGGDEPRNPSGLAPCGVSDCIALHHKPGARPGGHPARTAAAIVSAILWVMRCGNHWRPVPYDLPPWQTADYYFLALARRGHVGAPPRGIARTRRHSGREATTSAAILDSQSIKTGEGCPAGLRHPRAGERGGAPRVDGHARRRAQGVGLRRCPVEQHLCRAAPPLDRGTQVELEGGPHRLCKDHEYHVESSETIDLPRHEPPHAALTHLFTRTIQPRWITCKKVSTEARPRVESPAANRYDLARRWRK